MRRVGIRIVARYVGRGIVRPAEGIPDQQQERILLPQLRKQSKGTGYTGFVQCRYIEGNNEEGIPK